MLVPENAALVKVLATFLLVKVDWGRYRFLEVLSGFPGNISLGENRYGRSPWLPPKLASGSLEAPHAPILMGWGKSVTGWRLCRGGQPFVPAQTPAAAEVAANGAFDAKDDLDVAPQVLGRPPE